MGLKSQNSGRLSRIASLCPSWTSQEFNENLPQNTEKWMYFSVRVQDLISSSVTKENICRNPHNSNLLKSTITFDSKSYVGICHALGIIWTYVIHIKSYLAIKAILLDILIRWNIFNFKIYSSFAIAWINPREIMLNEISHTEKDKYCMISLICGIF